MSGCHCPKCATTGIRAAQPCTGCGALFIPAERAPDEDLCPLCRADLEAMRKKL